MNPFIQEFLIADFVKYSRHIFHSLQCGEMTDIRLVKTIKGKSKGYAYVEFKDEVSIEL